MKTNSGKFGLLTAICVAACIAPQRASSASYALGISPNNDTSQRTEALQSLLVFVLEAAAPGDEIGVVDALNQRLVARFTIPEGKPFQANARARAQRLAPQLAALKQFCMAERAYPREMAGVVALPQFLDFVATQLRRPGEPARVIVLGSPFYMDPNGDGPCNMDSAFPSDAHITADQGRSVFGCASRKGVLSGMTVHYAYLNTQFLNDYHQERVTRFWALYCQQAGAALCTFCSDPSLAFQRARENIQQSCVTAHLDRTDTKIEMRQVLRRGAPATLTVTNLVGRVAMTSEVPQTTASVSSPKAPVGPTNRPSITEFPSLAPTKEPGLNAVGSTSELRTEPSSLSITQLAEAFPLKPTGNNKVGVGIAWSAPVDLDLWVRANPNARDLYWHNTTTREGHYFKDWRNGNMGGDYEYIELTANPSLDLNSLGCWINYYEGRATPVRGVVLVFYEGRSYFGEFNLNAPYGNKGGEKERRDQSRYWVRINPADIIKAGNQVRPRVTTR